MIHLQMNIQCHDVFKYSLTFFRELIVIFMWTLNLTGFIIKFVTSRDDTFEGWIDFGMFLTLIDLTTDHHEDNRISRSMEKQLAVNKSFVNQ